MSGIIRSLCVLSVFFSAVMLIIPEGSVKTRLMRARKKLKAMLEEE